MASATSATRPTVDRGPALPARRRGRPRPYAVPSRAGAGAGRGAPLRASLRRGALLMAGAAVLGTLGLLSLWPPWWRRCRYRGAAVAVRGLVGLVFGAVGARLARAAMSGLSLERAAVRHRRDTRGDEGMAEVAELTNGTGRAEPAGDGAAPADRAGAPRARRSLDRLGDRTSRRRSTGGSRPSRHRGALVAAASGAALLGLWRWRRRRSPAERAAPRWSRRARASPRRERRRARHAQLVSVRRRPRRTCRAPLAAAATRAAMQVAVAHGTNGRAPRGGAPAESNVHTEGGTMETREENVVQDTTRTPRPFESTAPATPWTPAVGVAEEKAEDLKAQVTEGFRQAKDKLSDAYETQLGCRDARLLARDGLQPGEPAHGHPGGAGRRLRRRASCSATGASAAAATTAACFRASRWRSPTPCWTCSTTGAA